MIKALTIGLALCIAMSITGVVFSGTALAEVDTSKFNSAISAELGKAADTDVLYQRADQIYDVIEHDDTHIIWKFAGTTGDYAFVFADGRLAVASMSSFDLSAKDTLEKGLNDIIDLIDVVSGVDNAEREHAVDHAIYYANEAGIYHRLKYNYDTNFNLKLNIPDCEVRTARLTVHGYDLGCVGVFPTPGQHYFIDDSEVSGCDITRGRGGGYICEGTGISYADCKPG